MKQKSPHIYIYIYIHIHIRISQINKCSVYHMFLQFSHVPRLPIGDGSHISTYSSTDFEEPMNVTSHGSSPQSTQLLKQESKNLFSSGQDYALDITRTSLILIGFTIIPVIIGIFVKKGFRDFSIIFLSINMRREARRRKIRKGRNVATR